MVRSRGATLAFDFNFYCFEGRRQKAGGRRQKAGGRRQKAGGRRLREVEKFTIYSSHLFVYPLSFILHRSPFTLHLL
jgi:hypothetical protein